jgi:acyl-CoA synthetase (NDP forming)
MPFSPQIIRNINAILRTAYEEGRTTLYEFEIYAILSQIGLESPEFEFIRRPENVSDALLKKLGSPVVIKIVSPQIAHKQNLGGVKILTNTDPLFVEFVLVRMKEEVLSHFRDDNKPEIEGFLLTEFLPHTQALGNEVLFGFKEDIAFGPVLTLSKGGDDAEFFAKYYDPANLSLPPLDEECARHMVDTLNIKHKYLQIGHPEYLESIASAASTLSYLSYHYSFVSKNRPKFIIKALDVNPFVFSRNRFIAIDGFAQFISASEEVKSMPKIDLTNLDAFFSPRGIAIIGVSSELSKHSLGRDIAKVMHDLEREDIYIVNPKGGSIILEGTEYKFYENLDDLPETVDLVVYAGPAQFMIDFITNIRKNVPKGIILISGIPTSMNYSELSMQLAEFIPSGVRVIGPNCMGVFVVPDDFNKGLNTLFIEGKRLEIKYSKFSNTVLLTQSGALAVTEIDRLQNSGLFKSIVSFGNKYDVKITDLMAYFAKDSSIDLISLYIEGLDPGEGRLFFELSKEIKKPVLVYKAGRTEAGARAAASHTASMSGSYDVFKAACFQSGVILAENIEDHYNFAKAFSLLAHKVPSNNRVAGVVNAGFECTVGADELKDLKLAQLSEKTVHKLNSINRYGLVDTSSPFLDITPMANDRMYADSVEALLEDSNVDCVFVAVVPHPVTLKTGPMNCRDDDSLANLLIILSKQYTKPMVVSVNAGRYYQNFVSMLEENGLPVYGDIRSAIKSLDRFVSYHMDKEHRKIGAADSGKDQSQRTSMFRERS